MINTKSTNSDDMAGSYYINGPTTPLYDVYEVPKVPIADPLTAVFWSPKEKSIKDTITHSAKVRVNRPTLTNTPAKELLPRVKMKLLKKLLADMESSGAIEITTITAPSGAITFKATVSLVFPDAKA